MKSIECDPKCGFLVRSHDEKEVISIAKTHGKAKHNMSATDNDLKKMMKDI
jgi:predicted small metal-binding protein